MQPAVPRCFDGSTIVCLGSGPSLTPDDVSTCQSKAVVIAINDACYLAPWASVIVAADLLWWARNVTAQQMTGLKYALASAHPRVPGVTVLERTGQSGLEIDPSGVRSGGHSGYAAINIAVHLGARRIVLLGYDFQADPDGRHHFFGEHPDGSHPRYEQWQALYDTLLAPLRLLGITLINASRVTALDLPRLSLDEALCV